MTSSMVCWIALGGTLGVLLCLAGLWRDVRRHRRPSHHFDPLPELTPPRSVTRWPPRPVRVLPEPTFHDAEAEGWLG